MKVCLIAPPTVRVRYNISGVHPMPPLGLAYIAAVLEKEGFSPEIFDMPALKAGIPHLEKYLKNRDFAVYGLSCNIFNLKQAIRIAKLIKEKNSKAIVVAGGRCNALPPESIFKYGKELDVIVNAEGENAMLELCKLFAKDGSLKGIAGIKGISYKDNGRVIRNEPASFVDMDKLPFPARHLLPMRHYRMHPPFGAYPPLTIVETSRGCVYNCSFCGLSSAVRQRSVPNIIEEIKDLVKKYKVREIHFVDPNFTYKPDRAEKFCQELINSNIKIHWTCKTRVDLVTENLLKLMAKSGCYMISYGVESGKKEMLGALNKQIGVGHTLNAFKWTHNSGIRSLAYVIIGYPGEDEGSLEETKKLVKDIDPDFVLYNEFFLIPGSPLANQYHAENKLNYDELIEFYFKEGSKDAARTRFSGQLKELNRSFYLRPRYLLIRILRLRNFQDLMNMTRGVFYLLLDKIRIKRIF